MDGGLFDLTIRLDEMAGQRHAEILRLGAQKTLGQDVDGVLHGVGGDDQTVVGAGVGSRKLALQHDGDFEFFDGVAAAAARDFHHADAGLAIGMS